jgi:lysophospholipase L1-like esterase
MSNRNTVVVAMISAVLAIGSAVALVACSPSLPDPVSEPRDPNATRVAFYGDSYTLGTGASDADLRWSTIICNDRGWSEFNPSVNGLGFINNRSIFGDGDEPSQVIDDNPDIVFVTMGLNDNFSFDAKAAEIEAQIFDDLTRLNNALPDARFIVVEPFWYTDERPRSVEVINGWVKDAAAQIGADYIPGASRWIEGHPEWIADDGLHPNDEGYAAIAQRMNAELAKLGL